MFTLFKRPLHILSSKLRRKRRPAEWMKEKWIADFSKPEKSCFDIKTEISSHANLEKGALFLGLKKKSSMASLETADRVYVDQVVEARFRFDSLGGYCAAGIMFRVIERGTYYLALVSSKGYFRLDAVSGNIPRPLVGWTEAPDIDPQGVKLGIVAQGDHFIFMLNDRWIAEVHDDSIPGGHLGFALVSYDKDSGDKNVEDSYYPPDDKYAGKAWLDYLAVDSRFVAVKEEYGKWNTGMETSAESRLRLAESFVALGRFDLAYNQILKTWKQREEAARSVMATFTEMRARGELLFAAQMASRLGEYAVAEEYINVCLALSEDEKAGKAETFEALCEKAIILSAQDKHAELGAFLPGYVKRVEACGPCESLPPLYALLGHACWSLQDYKGAALAWDKAFSLNNSNGLYAVSAAKAWEMLGKSAQALKRCLAGGNCFLAQENYHDLEALVPRLLAFGKRNWEAHALAGKWALATGDNDRAEAELALSDELRNAALSKAQARAKTAAQAEAAPEPARAKPAAKPPKKPSGKAKPGATAAKTADAGQKKKPSVPAKKIPVKKTAAKPGKTKNK